MNKLIIIILTIASFGCQGIASRDEERTHLTSSNEIIGSIISLNTEFDMYRVRKGPRSDPTYEYVIMPAPEIGIRGGLWTYLGRAPSGTRWKIISVNQENTRRWTGYQIKPLSILSQDIQGNSDRKIESVETPLEEQVFWISHIADGLGICEKEPYPSGIPKLNDIWFTLIDQEK